MSVRNRMDEINETNIDFFNDIIARNRDEFLSILPDNVMIEVCYNQTDADAYDTKYVSVDIPDDVKEAYADSIEEFVPLTRSNYGTKIDDLFDMDYADIVWLKTQNSLSASVKDLYTQACDSTFQDVFSHHSSADVLEELSNNDRLMELAGDRANDYACECEYDR
jgi:hypothetical protein